MQNNTFNDVRRSTDYHIYNLKHKPIQDLLIMEIKNEIEYGRIGEPPTIIDKHGNRLLVGNNGKEWRSMPNKNSRFRWIQTSRTQW